MDTHTSVAGITKQDDIPASITNTRNMHENIFRRFGHWFQGLTNMKKFTFILGIFFAVIIILAGGLYAYIIMKGNQKPSKPSAIVYSPTPTSTPTPITAANPLTGEVLTGTDTQVLQRPPLSVMIENSITARPQTGLNQADIVYEALAEGGITRFMAVFLGHTPQIIGPIRSARTYYLAWASEYNPVYVHWGENSDVLPSLAVDNIRNLDALVQPGTDSSCGATTTTFCRDSTRYAPHNGYGFPTKMWDYATSQGWSGASQITSWQFKDDEVALNRGTDGSTLAISFMQNDPDYAVKWVYNKTANDFVRYDYGDVADARLDTNPQIDRLDNTNITTKNIVIEYLDGNLYTSSGGKEVYSLTTVGTGKASFFIDGKEVDGTWKKDSLTGKTMFYTLAGAPVSFDRGRTWISIFVNGAGSFSFSN